MRRALGDPRRLQSGFQSAWRLIGLDAFGIGLGLRTPNRIRPQPSPRVFGIEGKGAALCSGVCSRPCSAQGPSIVSRETVRPYGGSRTSLMECRESAQPVGTDNRQRRLLGLTMPGCLPIGCAVHAQTDAVGPEPLLLVDGGARQEGTACNHWVPRLMMAPMLQTSSSET